MKPFLDKLLYISSLLMVTVMLQQASSCKQENNLSGNCTDTLQKAITSAGSFFVKVHAGEDLVANGITDNVEAVFLKLRAEDPAQVTGATRVLARYYKKTDQQKYQDCINLVISQYLHGDSAHPRLVAIESLGKLGYSTALPEIVQDAQTGEGGFKAMARWVLANGDTPEAEDSLAALLKSPDVTDYRSAAYAFRFRPAVQPSTYTLLENCAGRLSMNDPATVYVLSAVFVHAPVEEQAAAKEKLFQMLQGPPAVKYEIGEALSLKGTKDDLPVLEELLKDPDNDVRVAAANAILKILGRES